MAALSMLLQLPSALSSAASLLGSLASLAAQSPRGTAAVIVVSMFVAVGKVVREGLWRWDR